MLVVFTSLLFVYCLLMDNGTTTVNGGEPQESLVAKANLFNSTVMSQLNGLCAAAVDDGGGKINNQQKVQQQEKGHHQTPHKSAKRLLCETVHLMQQWFSEIHKQSATEEVIRMAFDEIKNAVDTDIAMLVVYLDNLNRPAVSNDQWKKKMKEKLTTFTEFNNHMLEVSKKLYAALTNKQAEGDALELASDCLHTMKQLIDNDLFEQTYGKHSLQWALLRFSVCLWAYAALGVDAAVPIAKAALNFTRCYLRKNIKRKRIGESSSAEGLRGEGQQQHGQEEGQMKKKRTGSQ